MKSFLLIFFLLLPIENSFSIDYSSLDVGLFTYDSTGAFSMTTNAQFMITDPLGRMSGQNPFTGADSGGIPNSSYSNESLGELKEGGEASNAEDVFPGPESVSFEMGSILAPGTYKIEIYGMHSTKYLLEVRMTDSANNLTPLKLESYLNSGATNSFGINIDPTPGAPAPVITKAVTFDGLRNDVTVARQLNQLGDDKFAKSLIKNIDLAEKLSGVCNKRKTKKDKCEPAIAVLKLFIKRLELANRKCDNPADCDEEREWTAFRKEHGRHDDYKDFFRDWDRDDWHKHKKQCKRFVTDEAFKIIKDDAGWLIKSLDAPAEDNHGEHNRGKGKKD